MASTYDVIVDTPKYHRQGKVKLELSGDTARAHLDITDVGSLDAEGTRNGKDFDVAASRTSMAKISSSPPMAQPGPTASTSKRRRASAKSSSMARGPATPR